MIVLISVGVVCFVLGFLTHRLTVKVADHHEMVEKELARTAAPLPYQVIDGVGGKTLLNTDDLHLAKESRVEARLAGIPARLVSNGRDRG